MRLGILLFLLGACGGGGESLEVGSAPASAKVVPQKRLERVTVRVLGGDDRYQMEGFYDTLLGAVCEPIMIDRPRCVPIDRVRLGTYWADPKCTLPILLVRTIPTTEWGYYEVDGEGVVARSDPGERIDEVYRQEGGRCVVHPTNKLPIRYRTLSPDELVPIYRYAGPQD